MSAAVGLSREATLERLRGACVKPAGISDAQLERHVQYVADVVMAARTRPQNRFARPKLDLERLADSSNSNGPAASVSADSAAGPSTEKGR